MLDLTVGQKQYREAIKQSPLVQVFEQNAIKEAVELMFDVESEETNKTVFELYSPIEIYNHILKNQSLTIQNEDSVVELKPYLAGAADDGIEVGFSGELIASELQNMVSSMVSALLNTLQQAEVRYQWMNENAGFNSEMPTAELKYLSIEAEVDPSSLLFSSPEEAKEAIDSLEWDVTPDDVGGGVFVQSIKFPATNPYSEQ